VDSKGSRRLGFPQELESTDSFLDLYCKTARLSEARNRKASQQDRHNGQEPLNAESQPLLGSKGFGNSRRKFKKSLQANTMPEF
jgi:hypothetical protein